MDKEYTPMQANSYNGKWEDDKRTGKHTYSNGDEYVGDFKNDNFHGRVVFAKSGETYSGSWLDGKRTGYGTISFNNGDKYEGMFLDGEFHGNGSLLYANGNQYKGQWQQDKKSGVGTFIYSNGDKYEGGWGNDKKDGLVPMFLRVVINMKGCLKIINMRGGDCQFISGNTYDGQWQ